MSQLKRALKQRAVHELREYIVISSYLFMVFALLVVYKSVILREYHIEFALHGFALINALALAKVVLVAQDFHLADWFRDAPLIYPTLLKSLVFTLVLSCFKIAEDAVIGMFHGKSFHASLAELGGGSWTAIACLTALLWVMLIPFFGFTELRRVFGPERLIGVFFRPRSVLNLPPTSS